MKTLPPNLVFAKPIKSKPFLRLRGETDASSSAVWLRFLESVRLPVHIMFTSSFCHGSAIQRLASSQMWWPTTIITRTKMTVRLTANPPLFSPPTYDHWPAWVNYNLLSAVVPTLKARSWKFILVNVFYTTHYFFNLYCIPIFLCPRVCDSGGWRHYYSLSVTTYIFIWVWTDLDVTCNLTDLTSRCLKSSCVLSKCKFFAFRVI